MERVLTALGIALAVVVFMSVFLAGSIAYSQTRGVTIEGKNPAQFVKAQSGKAWAVVIGINAYQHAPRLSYAVADAQSMEDLLTRQGFSVVSFYDEQATRQAILTELRNCQRGQQADDQHDDEQFHEGEAALKARVSSHDRLQTKKLLQGRI